MACAAGEQGERMKGSIRTGADVGKTGCQPDSGRGGWDESHV